MLVKTLFSHFFNKNTEVFLYESVEAKASNIAIWRGYMKELEGGSRNTYNYYKVMDWFMNQDGKLIIVLK